MGLVITRVWYCHHCGEKQRPNFGERFVVMGRTHQALTVHNVTHSIHKYDKGFTPHLIEILKFDRLKSSVHVRLICAMENCGVSIRDEENQYAITIERTIETDILLRTWNEVVQFTGSGYELD
jgi:hypothetical protein